MNQYIWKAELHYLRNVAYQVSSNKCPCSNNCPPPNKGPPFRPQNIKQGPPWIKTELDSTQSYYHNLLYLIGMRMHHIRGSGCTMVHLSGNTLYSFYDWEHCLILNFKLSVFFLWFNLCSIDLRVKFHSVTKWWYHVISGQWLDIVVYQNVCQASDWLIANLGIMTEYNTKQSQ